MMNKKGEWFARDWVIAILLFSGVMALLFVVSTDALTGYDRTDLIDPVTQQRYNEFTNTTTQINSMFTSISNSSGLSFTNTIDIIFTGTTSVISLVFGSIGIFNSQVSNIAIDVGLPNQIAFIAFPILIGIIVTSLVFIVISATARNKI